MNEKLFKLTFTFRARRLPGPLTTDHLEKATIPNIAGNSDLFSSAVSGIQTTYVKILIKVTAVNKLFTCTVCVTATISVGL